MSEFIKYLLNATRLIILLVVGHCIAVLHMDYSLGYKAEQRSNHSDLSLIPSDVCIANIEQHAWLQLHRNARKASRQVEGRHIT